MPRRASWSSKTNRTLALLLAYNLEAEGYVVESVERGDEARIAACRERRRTS